MYVMSISRKKEEEEVKDAFFPHLQMYCIRFHVKILLWAIFVCKEPSFTLQFD